jgi:hypothetical protein
MEHRTVLRSRLPLLVVALAIVCLASLALAARAQAFVYWSNYENSSIGRADNDGSGVDQTFISGTRGPSGIVVDGQHIYWTEWSSGTIARANLDGSGVNLSFIANAGRAVALAIDKDSIYWITYSPAVVGRANLDGSGANSRWFDPKRTYGEGIAVYGNYLYWSWGLSDAYQHFYGGVDRAKTDGSGYTPGLLAGDAGGPGFWALWAGPTYFYWTDGMGIGRATTPYAYFPHLWGGVSAPYSNYGLTKEGDYLYWTGYAKIGRSTLDTKDYAPELITTATQPHGVAADSETAATISLYTLRRHVGRAGLSGRIARPLKVDLTGARRALLRGREEIGRAELRAAARRIRAEAGAGITSRQATRWLRVIARAQHSIV